MIAGLAGNALGGDELPNLPEGGELLGRGGAFGGGEDALRSADEGLELAL